jgi:hypothetical protein
MDELKPDRHVTQTIQMYGASEQQDLIEADIAEIRRVFGHIGASDLRLLRTSLLGARKTPPGTPINQADQLVWLYRSTLGLRSHPPPRWSNSRDPGGPTVSYCADCVLRGPTILQYRGHVRGI